MGAQKLWVPPTQIATVPNKEIQIVREMVAPGQRVFGYIIGRKGLPCFHLTELADDALDYFPSGPVMVLTDCPEYTSEMFTRFVFTGSKEALISNTKGTVVGGFDSAESFAWMAAR